MAEIHLLLQKYWGYSSFRPLQEQIITAILEGKDALVLLPTGSGKSLCFQLPALCKEGIMLVVTPLIALMKDQVSQLAQKAIHAEAIFSGMSNREIERKLDHCLYGPTKLLYVSPERLQTELFQTRVATMPITTLVVDEAHCISQWGYDFRPSYLEIAHFKQTIPKANTIAFTATATQSVQLDIQQQLALSQPLHFAQTLYKPHIVYWVNKTENKTAQLLKALQQTVGSAIVYVQTRKKAQIIASFLHTHHIAATFYHAGLTITERTIRQEAWSQNNVRVMVATTAFGMGIDKANVSLVAHMDLPTSLEVYYQETGRAGRNNATAYAILWYNLQDIILLKQQWEKSYPSIDQIRKVYQHLVNYFKMAVGSHAFVTYDFDLEAFKNYAGLNAKAVYHGLKILASEGFLQLNEAYYQPSKLYCLLSSKELYDFQILHPNYDFVIKGLLRIYGGALFVPYCTITEKKIAQLIQSSEAMVQQQLQALHRLKIIEYFPQKNQPQITFLTPRYKATALPLRIDSIEQKNRTAYKKIEAVIQYITDEQHCRMGILLAYFDEKTVTCHKCDFCRRNAIKRETHAQWRNYIIEAIQQGKQELKQLTENIAIEEEEHLLAAIRMMLDAKEIYYQMPGHLQINSSNMKNKKIPT